MSTSSRRSIVGTPVPAVAARRRLVAVATLATSLALAAASTPDVASAQSAPPGKRGPVFVLNAGSGTFERLSGDRYRLRLGKVSRHTTTKVGEGPPDVEVTTRELVDKWHELGFGRNSPTAKLHSHKKGARLRPGLALRRPRLRGSELRFHVRPLDVGREGAGAGAAARSPLPRRLAFTSIYIDGAGAKAGPLDEIRGPEDANDPIGYWHEFRTFIDAWAGDGDCKGQTFGVGGGQCFGTFTKGGTYPFNTTYGGKGYFDWGHGTESVEVFTQAFSGHLSGRLPSRGSAEYYVDDSSRFSSRPGVHTVWSGTDPAKLGDRGGPLAVDVEYHNAFVFANDGYTMDVHGYLWCTWGRDETCMFDN